MNSRWGKSKTKVSYKFTKCFFSSYRGHWATFLQYPVRVISLLDIWIHPTPAAVKDLRAGFAFDCESHATDHGLKLSSSSLQSSSAVSSRVFTPARPMPWSLWQRKLKTKWCFNTQSVSNVLNLDLKKKKKII